jgi:hypothetical protein
MINRWERNQDTAALAKSLRHKQPEIGRVAEAALAKIAATSESDTNARSALDELSRAGRWESILKVALDGSDPSRADPAMNVLRLTRGNEEVIANALVEHLSLVCADATRRNLVLPRCAVLVSLLDAPGREPFRKSLAAKVEKSVSEMCAAVTGVAHIVGIETERASALDPGGCAGMLFRDLAGVILDSTVEKSMHDDAGRISAFRLCLDNLNVSYLDDPYRVGLEEGRKRILDKLSWIKRTYPTFPDLEVLQKRMLACVPRLDGSAGPAEVSPGDAPSEADD